jgi:hypothetical protein
VGSVAGRGLIDVAHEMLNGDREAIVEALATAREMIDITATAGEVDIEEVALELVFEATEMIEGPRTDWYTVAAVMRAAADRDGMLEPLANTIEGFIRAWVNDAWRVVEGRLADA